MARDGMGIQGVDVPFIHVLEPATVAWFREIPRAALPTDDEPRAEVAVQAKGLALYRGAQGCIRDVGPSRVVTFGDPAGNGLQMFPRPAVDMV